MSLLKPRSKPRPGKPTGVSAPASAPATAELEQRRERLARDFEALQSDLGGLVYEMAIRDSYRLDVVTRQAARLQAVDAELTKVERMLSAPVAPPPPPAVPAPALATPAVAVCPACASPVQQGATYCGRCGTPLDRSSVPPPPPAAGGAP